MNDQQLLDVLATTDRYPTSRPLPDGWLRASEDAPPDAQGSENMSTTHKQRSISREAGTPAPNRWRVATAAIAVVVLAITAIMVVNRGGEEVVDEPTITTVPADAQPSPRLVVAEALVDAFYSFDSQPLSEAVGDPTIDDEILGFQQFYRAVNSTVVGREPCSTPGTSQVFCSIVTADDISRPFGEQASHRFTVTFADGTEIIDVSLLSPDTASLEALRQWITENHLDVWEIDCATTAGAIADDPERCASAVVSLIPEFIASDTYTGP